MGVAGPMQVMNETLKRIEAHVEKLAEAVAHPVTVGKSTVGSEATNTTQVTSASSQETRTEVMGQAHQESAPKFPIPYEFQELKNTVLNKEFGIEIDYIPDQVAMHFHILVPKKYSNAGAPHWETYKEDRRSQVIANALGANGVRSWMEQVYNNFSEATKSLIMYDRAQV